jgi:hypothetical protein
MGTRVTATDENTLEHTTAAVTDAAVTPTVACSPRIRFSTFRRLRGASIMKAMGDLSGKEEERSGVIDSDSGQLSPLFVGDGIAALEEESCSVGEPDWETVSSCDCDSERCGIVIDRVSRLVELKELVKVKSVELLVALRIPGLLCHWRSSAAHAPLTAENAAMDSFADVLNASGWSPGRSDCASVTFDPGKATPFMIILCTYTSEMNPAPSPGAQPTPPGQLTFTLSNTEPLMGTKERQETEVVVLVVLVMETFNSERAAAVKGIEPSADCDPPPETPLRTLQALTRNIFPKTGLGGGGRTQSPSDVPQQRVETALRKVAVATTEVTTVFAENEVLPLFL